MLSVVVIGKNEALNLKNLYNSLVNINISKEIIYVDSASDDNSVEISRHYCDKVVVLEKSDKLCASAGRYIGTQYAKYTWILYLDGDMELENEFIEFLNNKDFEKFDTNISGFMGFYKYIYKDDSSDENRLLQPKNKIVEHFGGAVMLRKDIVISAGNWNPSVVANEEFDLYVRIQKLGFFVYGLDIKMVKHIAKKVSNFNTLISLFYPLNKRFYGFGQSLVSQYKHGTLCYFIKKRPYPFVYLIVIILSIYNSNLLLLILLLFVYISFHKKWHYNILYFSDIIRGVTGIFHSYNYTPKVKFEY